MSPGRGIKKNFCARVECYTHSLLIPHPPDDAGNETTRPLGLIVARGTLLVLISPLDGSEQIENPFTQAEE